MLRPAFFFALASLAVACGDDGSGAIGPRPEIPAENDPAFSIENLRTWNLIGNELTPGHDVLEVVVTVPDGVKEVHAWIGDGEGHRMARGDGYFADPLDISHLGPGEHELVLAEGGASTAFARVTFMRSHPYYTVVTTDWDDAVNTITALELQEDLHSEHPELLLTHFVGPYTFTDPEVDDAAEKDQADWVKNMRDTHGDEIGLHIHAYCNFVDRVGEILGEDPVACRTEPSVVYEAGDETGYSVLLASYTEEELTKMLRAADVLFEDSGLGKPTSFRAGAWAADADVLSALAGADYVADTSAANWAYLQDSWEGAGNGLLFSWNKENWADIGDTSQPYFPSAETPMRGGSDAIDILEVPDNGILVDYISTEEMIAVFEANWPEHTPLGEPRQFSVGYHPSNFNWAYKQTITYALNHVDQFLASRDGGPVVYSRLSDLALVWPKE